jgi:hypothetical protein
MASSESEVVVPEQLSKEDVRKLYRAGKHAEIVAALEAGQLEAIQGRKPSSAPDPEPDPAVQLAPPPKAAPSAPLEPAPTRPLEGLHSGSIGPNDTGQLTRAELCGLSPEEILALKAEGRLDDLLRIRRRSRP